MGHTSRFTFPLPGRRNKAVPPQSTPAPLTKAQKILGTGQSTSSRDHSRWETTSNSGISISVSESTASHVPSEAALGVLHEGKVLGNIPDRQGRWEVDSEVMPQALMSPMGLGIGMGNDAMTDASSIRRRQSSSTIASYYDKSKVPLSISQQTANSAMAKGLPSKASALLDMDGTASPGRARKKKPAKLDLSYLLPKSRSSRLFSSDTQKAPVLHPDLITRSPSIMSTTVSPAVSPPIIPQRADRRNRMSTKERLGEMPPLLEGGSQHQASPSPRGPLPVSDAARHQVSKSTVYLHNLYEHYEQRTFQDILGDDNYSHPSDQPHPPAPERRFPAQSYPTPPATTSSKSFLSPHSASTARTPQSSKATSTLTAAETFMSPFSSSTHSGSSSNLISPPADCSASVSSRHTRTSKASKRTDRSIADVDLQQNSMLSLSSDSEDDGDQVFSLLDHQGKTALSAPGDGTISPRSAIFPRSATASTAGSKPVKRASFAQEPSTIPSGPKAANAAQSPNIPRINARSSSLHPLPPADVAHSAMYTRPSSRTSNASTTTATHSLNVRQSSIDSQMGFYDSRSIGMVPAQSPYSGSARSGSGNEYPRRSSYGWQPTPPLSPTGVDFYLQSQRNSMALASSVAPDTQSTHSGKSQSNYGGRQRPDSGSSNSSAISPKNTASGRFMAVTRQEELLLAALRQKRAMMRETIIAEFEEEQHMGFDHDSHDASLPDAALHRLRTQESFTSGASQSGSSSHKMSRHSSQNTIRKDALSPAPRPALSVAGKMAAGHIGAELTPNSTPREGQSSTGSDRVSVRGQILLMLDRSVETIDAFDAAEPSPDLSDFLDFDDRTTGSEEYHLHTPMDVEQRSLESSSGSISRISNSSRSQQRMSLSAMAENPQQYATHRRQSSNKPRKDSEVLSSRLYNPSLEGRDVHVRIVDDQAEELGMDGIPRPDSPISPVTVEKTAARANRKKSQVRLSAVGGPYKPHLEAGWWADDG